MRTVGLKVLKNKLSEYVRLASEGETILVTNRDRVVAELLPPRGTRARRIPDAMLAELIRTGLLTPAVSSSGELPEAPPVAPLEEILTELEADRADR